MIDDALSKKIAKLATKLHNKKFVDEDNNEYAVRISPKIYKTHTKKYIDFWLDSNYYLLRILAVHKNFLFRRRKWFHIQIPIDDFANIDLDLSSITFIECKDSVIKLKFVDIGTACLNEI